MNRIDHFKKRTLVEFFVILAIILIIAAMLAGCNRINAQSDSGVKKVHTTIATGEDGMTNEQRNIERRYKIENDGAIKHLYVISPYSGDVLLYSTVKGKVTSGGKRLTPKTVASQEGQYCGGAKVIIAGRPYYTSEILQDDGTYGDSCEYIYWFDSKGIYHQHLNTGGQIIHISEQPIRVGKVILNLETSEAK